MRCRSGCLIFAVTLLFATETKIGLSQAADSSHAADFRQLLQKLARTDADPCTAPGDEKEDTGYTEYEILQQAEHAITFELNGADEGPHTPSERASTALKKLEQLSAEVNAAWPKENRFHFEIVELPPILLVKTTIRTHAAYLAFGIPAEKPKGPKSEWQEIGSGGHAFERESISTSLDIYPLQRTASGNVRFLASLSSNGCAGNTFGVLYDVQEWDPKNSDYLEQLVKQDGLMGIDASSPESLKGPFPPVGKLVTEGARMTLPYCWFSAIDTWDNPSLCAVDTYDLSGDSVRFVGRRYNRPDLVPIAKVLEYSEKHDYPEVRAFCGSDAVAAKMMHESYGFDAELETVRLGPGRERVRAAYSGDLGFVVEKRGERWVVISFSAN